jgi:hypothetical protein
MGGPLWEPLGDLPLGPRPGNLPGGSAGNTPGGAGGWRISITTGDPILLWDPLRDPPEKSPQGIFMGDPPEDPPQGSPQAIPTGDPPG